MKTKSAVLKTTNPNTMARRLRTAFATRLPPLVLLLTLPAAVQAQYNYTTNADNTITITGYACTNGPVIIPDTIYGLPVTSIGGGAFGGCNGLTSLTIPNSVTSIGSGAFEYCQGLTNVTIGTSVTSIGAYAFYFCAILPSVTIPNSVTSIGDYAFGSCGYLTSVTIGTNVTSIADEAFWNCYNLTSITIGSGVTSIGDYAFYYCPSLTGLYFTGNAPGLGVGVFNYDNNATAYYLPGTTGWATFGVLPTVCWNPQPQSVGVQANQFGFTITGSSNLVVVVEACTNLANAVWSPVGTNTLSGGSSYFSDPQWTNYPARFYRIRPPW